MISIGHRYSLLAVVGAGFVVAAPLATWLAVGAVTEEHPLPLTLTMASDAASAVEPVASLERPESAPRDEDLHELAQDAHFVPAFANGKVIGIKLFFQSGRASMFQQAGLENGDIVTRVNGIDLTAPERGIAAYDSARASRVVVVDFLRRGQPGTLTHSLPPSE